MLKKDSMPWPIPQNLPDPAYYENMNAFLQVAAALAGALYPIAPPQVIRIKNSLAPLVDVNTGLPELDMFYISSASFGPSPVILSVSPSTYAAFNADVNAYVPVLVSQLAYMAGVSAPAPIGASPAPVPPVITNPVGPAFDAGNGVTGYVNLATGPNSPAVGATFTSNGVLYVLTSTTWMFGTKTYWVVKS